MKSYQESRRINTILVYAMLGAGAVLMIFPFLWMLLTSFKSAGESVQIPPTILPKEWLADNYEKALIALPFIKLYTNTVLLILFRVICAVAFSSAAGFAFAKLKFRGKNLLFSLVIMQMMLPSQIFIIPQYQMLAKMGLTNSIFALVFPGLVSAFGTFFLRQAYMGIPDELGEAAYLDGCTKWQTFTKVMMPLTKASMAALTIFHRSVCLCRPDVASDCQHGYQHDDAVGRPFYPKGPVHHQLSGPYGRFHAGHNTYGHPVPGVPEAVY